MNKDYISKKISELEPWYQKINFDGIITTKSNISGIPLWKVIKQNYLPDDLNSTRILDLGCNAGYMSCQMALLGCEVISVELIERYLNQAKFTKEYFEDKFKKKLNIKFVNSDICDLDFDSLGKFDYIFALAILYHIGKHKYGKYTDKSLLTQKLVIEKMTNMTSNILVRARNGKYNNVDYYNTIFSSFGFIPTNLIQQNVKRSIVLYKRK